MFVTDKPGGGEQVVSAFRYKDGDHELTPGPLVPLSEYLAVTQAIEKLEAGPVPDDHLEGTLNGSAAAFDQALLDGTIWREGAGPPADLSLTTLGGRVQEMESAYADLHTLAGELLATLTVPANRALILAGDVDALGRLMGFVDGWKAKYGHFPRPGAAFTGG